MAIHIRSNEKIQGIKYSERECLKISQLADDTTLFLADVESLRESLAFIESFGRSSGLKLNKDKSEAFWIGSRKACSDKPLGLKWTKEYIKCLGIYCSPNVESAINKNYEEKVNKLKKLLNMWRQRKLSLKGKISVLRSVALPQMLYVSSVLYTPQWVIEEVDDLFFDFLWSGHKPHVKREVIIGDIEDGGLKMPLFSAMVKSIKCTWIKRLVADKCKKIILLNVSFLIMKCKKCNLKTS